MIQRIPIEVKKRIRNYALTHTNYETRREFGVSKSFINNLINNPLYPIKKLPEPDQRIKEEPHICKKFGCGKTLTKTEKLYGNYCQGHSKILIV